LRREQAARVLVAVDPLADEIVVAEVAHVEGEPVHNRGCIDEAGRRRRLRRCGLPRQHEQRERDTRGSVHDRILT
jgi:hypothetical protein